MCFLALHDFVSVLKRWDTRRKTSSIWYNNLTNRQMLPSNSLEMFLECYSVEGINLIKHEISKPQLAMDIGLLWQMLTSNSPEMFLECYSVESIKLIKHEMSKPYRFVVSVVVCSSALIANVIGHINVITFRNISGVHGFLSSNAKIKYKNNIGHQLFRVVCISRGCRKISEVVNRQAPFISKERTQIMEMCFLALHDLRSR